MMKQTFARGFTLIELLVVIAIIGILASVVLASLNSARSKGQDAAIRSNLNNARAQAEIYYDDNSNSYASVCTTGSASTTPGIADLVAAATAAGTNTADCDDAAGAWAAEMQLEDGNYYCVDSTGVASETGGSKGASATVCP